MVTLWQDTFLSSKRPLLSPCKDPLKPLRPCLTPHLCTHVPLLSLPLPHVWSLTLTCAGFPHTCALSGAVFSHYKEKTIFLGSVIFLVSSFYLQSAPTPNSDAVNCVVSPKKGYSSVSNGPARQQEPWNRLQRRPQKCEAVSMWSLVLEGGPGWGHRSHTVVTKKLWMSPRPTRLSRQGRPRPPRPSGSLGSLALKLCSPRVPTRSWAHEGHSGKWGPWQMGAEACRPSLVPGASGILGWMLPSCSRGS